MKNVKSFIYRHHMLVMFFAVAMMSVANGLANDPHPEGDNGGGVWHPFEPIKQVITWAFLQAVRILS